jgi:hypothetical protein
MTEQGASDPSVIASCTGRLGLLQSRGSYNVTVSIQKGGTTSTITLKKAKRVSSLNER